MGIAQRSEDELLVRLRAGDESAFQQLVRENHRAMTRLASTFVQSASIADEVVQETWLAVIRGLDRFEGRSSLKTWIYRILVNRAKTRGVREQRTLPFSSLAGVDDEDGPTVDPERFLATGDRVRWILERPAEPLLRAAGGAPARRRGAGADLPGDQ